MKENPEHLSRLVLRKVLVPQEISTGDQNTIRGEKEGDNPNLAYIALKSNFTKEKKKEIIEENELARANLQCEVILLLFYLAFVRIFSAYINRKPPWPPISND